MIGVIKKKTEKGGFVDITASPISTRPMISLNEIELHRPGGEWVIIRNADSACVSQVAKMFFDQGR